MKIAFTKSEITEHLRALNLSPTGFVPTMGALHLGHLSLVERATNECPVVAVSIFVNPTQFNDKNDLKNYPRQVEKDIEMLSDVLRKNDILFTPTVEEIYPEKDTRIFDFGNLDKVMEGANRPGHFNGVGQVVTRLFEIVNPDISYFGQKDFQQLTIVRELVRQKGYKMKIAACPIIRESDGLAMSSRNQLLEPGIRKNAGIIFSAISRAAGIAATKNIAELRDFVYNEINRIPGFSVEYFEIADDRELTLIMDKKNLLPDRKYFACIAVRAGNIRLIDNIEISLV
ncbi:MAG TPA: pantoate--beta-alanine ligase [Ignavibacteriaceae bacterium]